MGDAYGDEEVYYCADIDSNGFKYDKKLNKFKSVKFNLDKFKIKLDRGAKKIVLAEENGKKIIFTCKNPFSQTKPELLGCKEDFTPLVFNIKNGKFVHSFNYGYVGSGSDSISTSYGTCDKF